MGRRLLPATLQRWADWVYAEQRPKAAIELARTSTSVQQAVGAGALRYFWIVVIAMYLLVTLHDGWYPLSCRDLCGRKCDVGTAAPVDGPADGEWLVRRDSLSTVERLSQRTGPAASLRAPDSKCNESAARLVGTFDVPSDPADPSVVQRCAAAVSPDAACGSDLWVDGGQCWCVQQQRAAVCVRADSAGSTLYELPEKRSGAVIEGRRLYKDVVCADAASRTLPATMYADSCLASARADVLCAAPPVVSHDKASSGCSCVTAAAAAAAGGAVEGCSPEAQWEATVYQGADSVRIRNEVNAVTRTATNRTLAALLGCQLPRFNTSSAPGLRDWWNWTNSPRQFPLGPLDYEVRLVFAVEFQESWLVGPFDAFRLFFDVATRVGPTHEDPADISQTVTLSCDRTRRWCNPVQLRHIAVGGRQGEWRADVSVDWGSMRRGVDRDGFEAEAEPFRLKPTPESVAIGLYTRDRSHTVAETFARAALFALWSFCFWRHLRMLIQAEELTPPQRWHIGLLAAMFFYLNPMFFAGLFFRDGRDEWWLWVTRVFERLLPRLFHNVLLPYFIVKLIHLSSFEAARGRGVCWFTREDIPEIVRGQAERKCCPYTFFLPEVVGYALVCVFTTADIIDFVDNPSVTPSPAGRPRTGMVLPMRNTVAYLIEVCTLAMCLLSTLLFWWRVHEFVENSQYYLTRFQKLFYEEFKMVCVARYVLFTFSRLVFAGRVEWDGGGDPTRGVLLVVADDHTPWDLSFPEVFLDASMFLISAFLNATLNMRSRVPPSTCPAADSQEVKGDEWADVMERRAKWLRWMENSGRTLFLLADTHQKAVYRAVHRALFPSGDTCAGPQAVHAQVDVLGVGDDTRKMGLQLEGRPGGGQGSIVVRVQPGSPAAAAGITPGTVISEIRRTSDGARLTVLSLRETWEQVPVRPPPPLPALFCLQSAIECFEPSWYVYFPNSFSSGSATHAALAAFEFGIYTVPTPTLRSQAAVAAALAVLPGRSTAFTSWTPRPSAAAVLEWADNVQSGHVVLAPGQLPGVVTVTHTQPEPESIFRNFKWWAMVPKGGLRYPAVTTNAEGDTILRLPLVLSFARLAELTERRELVVAANAVAKWELQQNPILRTVTWVEPQSGATFEMVRFKDQSGRKASAATFVDIGASFSGRDLLETSGLRRGLGEMLLVSVRLLELPVELTYESRGCATRGSVLFHTLRPPTAGGGEAGVHVQCPLEDVWVSAQEWDSATARFDHSELLPPGMVKQAQKLLSACGVADASGLHPAGALGPASTGAFAMTTNPWWSQPGATAPIPPSPLRRMLTLSSCGPADRATDRHVSFNIPRPAGLQENPKSAPPAVARASAAANFLQRHHNDFRVEALIETSTNPWPRSCSFACDAVSFCRCCDYGRLCDCCCSGEAADAGTEDPAQQSAASIGFLELRTMPVQSTEPAAIDIDTPPVLRGHYAGQGYVVRRTEGVLARLASAAQQLRTPMRTSSATSRLAPAPFDTITVGDCISVLPNIVGCGPDHVYPCWGRVVSMDGGTMEVRWEPRDAGGPPEDWDAPTRMTRAWCNGQGAAKKAEHFGAGASGLAQEQHNVSGRGAVTLKWRGTGEPPVIDAFRFITSAAAGAVGFVEPSGRRWHFEVDKSSLPPTMLVAQDGVLRRDLPQFVWKVETRSSDGASVLRIGPHPEQDAAVLPASDTEVLGHSHILGRLRSLAEAARVETSGFPAAVSVNVVGTVNNTNTDPVRWLLQGRDHGSAEWTDLHEQSHCDYAVPLGRYHAISWRGLSTSERWREVRFLPLRVRGWPDARVPRTHTSVQRNGKAVVLSVPDRSAHAHHGDWLAGNTDAVRLGCLMCEHHLSRRPLRPHRDDAALHSRDIELRFRPYADDPECCGPLWAEKAVAGVRMRGVEVVRVQPDSDAHRKGLRTPPPGCAAARLLTVNGVRIEDAVHFAQLLAVSASGGDASFTARVWIPHWSCCGSTDTKKESRCNIPGRVVVAFRGTMMDLPANLWTDLDFVQTPLESLSASARADEWVQELEIQDGIAAKEEAEHCCWSLARCPCTLLTGSRRSGRSLTHASWLRGRHGGIVGCMRRLCGWMQLSSGCTPATACRPCPAMLEPRVHTGFAVAWASMREQVLDAVQRICPADDPRPLYVTGHSLGGALATLAAFDIARELYRSKKDVAMYSFGSPRVGNPAFASVYELAVPDSWRVVNDVDLVPNIPSECCGWYAHAGQEVTLRQNGDLVVCPSYYETWLSLSLSGLRALWNCGSHVFLARNQEGHARRITHGTYEANLLKAAESCRLFSSDIGYVSAEWSQYVSDNRLRPIATQELPEEKPQWPGWPSLDRIRRSWPSVYSARPPAGPEDSALLGEMDAMTESPAMGASRATGLSPGLSRAPAEIFTLPVGAVSVISEGEGD